MSILKMMNKQAEAVDSTQVLAGKEYPTRAAPGAFGRCIWRIRHKVLKQWILKSTIH